MLKFKPTSEDEEKIEYEMEKSMKVKSEKY